MSDKRSIWLGFLVAAILLAYSNSFNNSFHFDDFHTITDNSAVQSLSNIPRFFTDATTFSVLPANRTYRPLVTTSLALDYALGQGYKPFWFHLSTFIWFLIEVLLLEALYRLLLDKIQPSPANQWLALFAAAWFGLHPAMAETVNYVIQRGDLYCTLGCVAALYLFARYPHQRRFGIYLLPFVLAMLSKPPAAVFSVLLILYVYFFEEPTLSSARRLRLAAAAAVPSVIVTALMLWLQSAMTPRTFMPSIISPWDYRLTQPFVWARYTAELFLPLHLNVDTDLGPFGELNAQAFAGLIFLAALLIGIWVTVRRRKLYPIAFGLLWFVITQLPTSLYPLSEVENDHRMFFSFVGLILAAVWAAALIYQRLFSASQRAKLQPVTAIVAVAILLGYGYGVHVRNEVWHDEESLWKDDAIKSPHNGRGLMNYGLVLMNRGAYPGALDYFTRALLYTPNYPSLEINLGVVNGAMADLGDTARAADAERHFQRAISLAPGNDEPHAFYGRWLVQHGRYAEGIAQLRSAISLDPQRTFQHDVLIDALARSGDMNGARQAAQETLAFVPNDLHAQQLLANPAMQTMPQPATQTATAQTTDDLLNQSLLLNQAGKYEESMAVTRKLLAINPNSAEAWNNIAANDEAMHRWDEAIDAAQHAIALKPDFQLAKNNLAWSISQKKLGVR